MTEIKIRARLSAYTKGPDLYKLGYALREEIEQAKQASSEANKAAEEADGSVISDVHVDEDLHLITTQKNGTVTNAGSVKIPVDTELSLDSENVVQNKVITRRFLDNEEALEAESAARVEADGHLQQEIDAIAAASDVVDVVGTYQELQTYDTSKLKDNDIVKVLSDESHEGAITYYRWKIGQHLWVYVGEQGPYYTKEEVDVAFLKKEDTPWEKGSGENSVQLKGLQNEASGIASHAEGRNNIASGDFQAVFGSYNEVDEDAAFIIGNGSPEPLSRSNAFKVMKNGATVAGKNCSLVNGGDLFVVGDGVSPSDTHSAIIVDSNGTRISHSNTGYEDMDNFVSVQENGISLKTDIGKDINIAASGELHLSTDSSINIDGGSGSIKVDGGAGIKERVDGKIQLSSDVGPEGPAAVFNVDYEGGISAECGYAYMAEGGLGIDPYSSFKLNESVADISTGGGVSLHSASGTSLTSESNIELTCSDGISLDTGGSITISGQSVSIDSWDNTGTVTINKVVDPTTETMAANKRYVDNAIASLSNKVYRTVYDDSTEVVKYIPQNVQKFGIVNSTDQITLILNQRVDWDNTAETSLIKKGDQGVFNIVGNPSSTPDNEKSVIIKSIPTDVSQDTNLVAKNLMEATLTAHHDGYSGFQYDTNNRTTTETLGDLLCCETYRKNPEGYTVDLGSYNLDYAMIKFKIGYHLGTTKFENKIKTTVKVGPYEVEFARNSSFQGFNVTVKQGSVIYDTYKMLGDSQVQFDPLTVHSEIVTALGATHPMADSQAGLFPNSSVSIIMTLETFGNKTVLNIGREDGLYNRTITLPNITHPDCNISLTHLVNSGATSYLFGLQTVYNMVHDTLINQGDWYVVYLPTVTKQKSSYVQVDLLSRTNTLSQSFTQNYGGGLFKANLRVDYLTLRYTGTGYPANSDVFPIIINLTRCFGAGNEPTTVEQLARYLGDSNLTDYFLHYGETEFSTKVVEIGSKDPDGNSIQLIPEELVSSNQFIELAPGGSVEFKQNYGTRLPLKTMLAYQEKIT